MASPHTKLRLLGHLCPCSVARPPCTDASFTQSYPPRIFQDPTDVLPTFYPPRDPKTITPVPSCLLLSLTPQKYTGPPAPHFSKISFAITTTLRQIWLHYHKLPTLKKQRENQLPKFKHIDTREHVPSLEGSASRRPPPSYHCCCLAHLTCS